MSAPQVAVLVAGLIACGQVTGLCIGWLLWSRRPSERAVHRRAIPPAEVVALRGERIMRDGVPLTCPAFWDDGRTLRCTECGWWRSTHSDAGGVAPEGCSQTPDSL